LPQLRLAACADCEIGPAKKLAGEFGILKACVTEELLDDPEIDLVINLTPPQAHTELNRKILEAGKHLFCEKPFAQTPEEAQQLLDLADRKGLQAGSAPDTFLGDAWQTARKALDEGLIGEPISFSMNVNRNIDFMASLFEFLRLPGGGFAYDYGVYYLTALVSLLGPVESLFSIVKNKAEIRTNCAPQSADFGKPYPYQNESQIYGLMNLRSGVTGTVSLDGDSALQDLALFYIYGSKGVLKLTCANDFGGEVTLIPSSFDPEEAKPVILQGDSPIRDGNRGIGPAEMADAIASGRPNRASKEMAFHVMDIIEQLMISSREQKLITLDSTCERPAAFPAEEILKLMQ